MSKRQQNKVFWLLISPMPERGRGQKVREEAELRATDHLKPRDAESQGGKGEESAVDGEHVTQAGNSTCELPIPIVTAVTEEKPQRSQAAESPVCSYTSPGSRREATPKRCPRCEGLVSHPLPQQHVWSTKTPGRAGTLPRERSHSQLH